MISFENIMLFYTHKQYPTLQWLHNEYDGVLNHQPHDCLLKLLSRRRSKKTPKLRVTGLCEGNSPVTGEFPTQRASNAKNVSIWWSHHEWVWIKCGLAWYHITCSTAITTTKNWWDLELNKNNHIPPSCVSVSSVYRWVFWGKLTWPYGNIQDFLNRYLLSHPLGSAMGCLLWVFGRKLTVVTACIVFMSGIMQRKGIMSSITFALAHGIVWSLGCKQGPWIPSTAYKQTYTKGTDALTHKQLSHFFPKYDFIFSSCSL